MTLHPTIAIDSPAALPAAQVPAAHLGATSCGAFAAVVATVTWLARGPALEDLDGANFRLGLDHFALALHQPHFPGYPVYMALAGVLYACGVDGVSALQLPGVVGWSAGCGALAYAAGRRHGVVTGALAACFAVLSPLAWLTAGRTGSDALGGGLLAFALAALSEADRRADGRLYALAGLLSGVVLGVRLSYAPAVAGLLVVLALGAHRRAALAAFAAGVAAWVLPFLALVGPATLLAETPSFLAGHFFRWGGTAFVASGPSFTARLAQWVTAFASQGLGWAAAPLLLAGLAAGAPTLPRRDRVVLAALAAPYTAWLLLGQNPEHPRHLLPLVPLGAVVIARGLARWPAAGAFAVVLLVAALVPLARTHATVPSPESQLAAYLVAHERPDQALLFAGQSERVLLATAPAFRVEYAPDAVEVARRLGHLHGRPPRLLWTDEFPGSDASPPGFGAPEVVAVFARDPAVDPHRPSITLFTATPEAP